MRRKKTAEALAILKEQKTKPLTLRFRPSVHRLGTERTEALGLKSFQAYIEKLILDDLFGNR